MALTKTDSSDPEALKPLIKHPDVQNIPDEKSAQRVLGMPVQLVAGAAYCAGATSVLYQNLGLPALMDHRLTCCSLIAASASMVLVNKAALSSFAFTAPAALLLFQCCVCVTLVQALSTLRVIRLEPW